MRRFEFIDGSSQKFWEITLAGTDFTVRWGRIGTEGQTQHKSFPSAAKAQAEHDKLVAEKQKKGYTEGTPTSAAPKPPRTKTPAPPPAPAPLPAAPPAALPSGPIAWTPELLDAVHPRRGGVSVSVRAPLEPKKAWALVRQDFKKKGPDPEAKDKHKHNLMARSRTVLARLQEDTPRLGTPEEDALLLGCLQHRTQWREKTRVDPAIDLLFALGGPVHATHAALLSMDLHVVELAQERKAVRQGLSRDTYYNGMQHGNLGGLPRLRALLATQTTDKDYRAARDLAASLRETEEELRSAAAYLFPTETAWVHAEAQVFAQKKGEPFILHSLSDPRALDTVTPHVDLELLLTFEDSPVASLLDGVGPRLAGFLGALLTRTQEQEEPLERAALRVWAGLVSRIDSDEAMTLLLERPEKEMLPLLREQCLRVPSRAARLLPRWALLPGKDGAGPRELLGLLAARHPEALQAALPELSEPERAVILRLQGQAAQEVPEAPAARLPPVLATPPWRSGQPPEAPPVLSGVSPPALPDALVWREGEREAWLGRGGPSYESYPTFTAAQWSALEKKLAQAKPKVREQLLEGEFFAHAPEALASKYLDTLGFDYDTLRWMPRIIAHLGLAALPAVERGVAEQGGNTLSLLMPLGASSLAPRMAEALGGKKSRSEAQDWLLRHPAHATTGLLAPALGKPGKARDAALAALRLLAAQGQKATVLDVARKTSPEVLAAVQRVLDFDPLQLYPIRLPQLPAALGIGSLPAPLLADRSAKLPPAAVEALATMLAFSPLDEPYAGLAQVKAACDRPSLARFAWALFEAWLLAGAPSKEGWCLLALGHLGDDDTARKLAPLIRQWPGEAAHARAVTGLDVLAAIGTDVTLIYLNGIAEKVKFKGLQQKAQEKIAQIAEARGLTREELGDRLVPDLGLDARGSLTLDFGPRAFTVGFDEQLKPFVRDAEGSPLKDLPKPTQKDDADKAQAAAAQWTALKKDTKTAASLQILRLELAMCARRRWSADVFRQFFVEHPLLIHVVRRLVWGTYSPEGALTATFRVAEDRSLADANDDTWSLPEDARVGLPHALELDARTAGLWGQVLADYQLLQPFPQLGRPTYAIKPAEKTATSLERVKGVKLSAGKVLGLEKRGWRRGAPQDAGVVHWMEKPLGGALQAELDLDEGLYTGMISESPEQTLGSVVLRTRQGWEQGEPQPLGSLDPILFSELVRDLEGLRPG